MGNGRWKSFRSLFLDTDLWVAVDHEHFRDEVREYTFERITFYRNLLDEHIRICPEFRDSLVPLDEPDIIHPLIRDMYRASSGTGTGPMSAVAGAVAEYICNDIVTLSNADEVIVENGGDIFMKILDPVTVSVHAGNSPLSDKISLVVKPGDTPLAICCSSGTVGHSLSFGIADACMIACRSGAVADACATAFCNEVKDREMTGAVTDRALQRADVMSVVIITGDKVGLGGSIEIALR